MNDLFHGFKFIRAYIYDLFILTKGDCTDHIKKIELAFNKLKGKGIKCNIESFSSEKPKWNIWFSGQHAMASNPQIKDTSNE